MAATSTEDDGFREIQLSGKQLFFLVMAASTVLTVAFMLGMLVGRGVRVEREELARAEDLVASPPTPAVRNPVPTADDDDPRKAAPPAPAESGDAESEPPVAVRRDPSPRPTTEIPPPSSSTAPKAAAANTSTAGTAKPAPAEPATPVSVAPVDLTPRGTPPPSAAAPAKSVAPPTPAQAPSDPVRSGYAVQVAAVDARSEADAIVNRLKGKGYSAYVETSRGSAYMFRVRVGTFTTRREAQTIAERLKNEEKFKPWVTR